jgi:DNA-binding response OmpR family regulator
VEIVTETDEILDKIRTGETEMLILGLEVFAEHSHELIPAIREIREDFPIIVVSSEPSLKFQNKARADGIGFYLVEPFGAEELKAVIRGAVSQTPFRKGGCCSGE